MTKKYCYDYPRPMMSADVAAICGDEILLIRRGCAPFPGTWALAGGFVGIDEEVEDAARRELLEETGIEVEALDEIGVYHKVGRDPRGRSVTFAFLCCLAEKPVAVAGDDASEVGWFRLDDLPALAFDHADIIADALEILE